jgi:hypothetical protein
MRSPREKQRQEKASSSSFFSFLNPLLGRGGGLKDDVFGEFGERKVDTNRMKKMK